MDQYSGPSVQGIRANNVAVALMDAHQFSEAVGRFQTACIMLPASDTGCLNAGIALLAMGQFGEAHKILTTAAARDPQNPRAWFNLGLLESAQGQTAVALADFAKVAALDPADADTQCIIGSIYVREQQYASAFSAFQAALKIDPSNAAAESGATEALAKMASPAAQQSATDATTRSSGAAPGQPLNENYGQQGKYSLAAEIPPPDVAPPAIPVHFIDVTRESGLTLPAQHAQTSPPASREIGSIADFLGSGACVFDFDGDGRPDIFLVDADGTGDAALFRNLGRGRLEDVTKAAHIDFHGEGMGCAVGDYDNDGHPDLALSFDGGLRLYHNNGNGTFCDVTKASGIAVDGLVMGLSFVDYDRDGNLDLYVTRFRKTLLGNSAKPFTLPDDPPAGNSMWRNNGDGTFSNVTAALGVAGKTSSAEAIATGLVNNGARDLLLLGLGSTPAVLLNERERGFKPGQWWGAETQGPTAGGVAFDFDKDGYMDLALTHWTPTTLGLWRNVAGKAFEHVALPDPGWMRAWGIAALDYDNDGWTDLVAVGDTFSGEGRIALLRNEGGRFRDVTHDTALDKISLHHPRSVIAFDADGDGSLYLLITQSHRPPVLLRAIGQDKHNWAQIALQGGTANRMALGVRVQIFSGALRQTWEIPASSGYLSQGPATISAGLGDEGLDAVRVRWADEVQVKVGLPANKKSLIVQDAANPRQISTPR